MEEMNKVMELEAVAIEEVKDLTLGQKCVGYAIVGLIGVGMVTVGSLAIKGSSKLYEHIKEKRQNKTINEIVDVDDVNIQEVNENETEEN